jgi:predicted  nucleic acid-binding Zn-ribbon protein
MITHKDPEIQFLINQIEQQRDLALSQSSAIYKKVVDLNKRIEDLENEIKNKKNTVVSINKVK